MNVSDYSNVKRLLEPVKAPKFYRAQLEICSDHLDDIVAEIKKGLQREGTLDRIKPGMTVGLTAGSREISNIALIIKTLADEIKRVGGKPFVFPAMGSHGGATAEGQRTLVELYGITEESVGCPIKATMETVYVGDTVDGVPVHVDKYAYEADAIIPVGRIKPHTDFRGPYESGILKMLTIGVGKQEGASICHALGMSNMSHNVEEISRVMIEKCNIPFGVGMIENAFHGTYAIAVIPGEKIHEEEPALLEKAKSLMPQIPFSKTDIIICEVMGKEISGTGMDTNVIGRSTALGVSKPFADRIGVLSLSEKSHGNFNGVGLADAIPKHYFDQMVCDQTYPNSITSRDTAVQRVPPIMPDDLHVVKFLMESCPAKGPKGYRIVWLKNTLSLNDFFVSEALRFGDEADPAVKLGDEAYELKFDENGMYAGFEKA